MTESTNAPVLRFSGFTEPWREKELGDLYVERAEPGSDALQVLSVSIYGGISDHEMDTEALGKHVRRSADKTLYKRVREGDVVLNMMRAWQGAIGVTRAEGMVSPAYITAMPNGQTSPRFMDHALRRSAVVKQMNDLSYGVTDFRKRLYWDSFERVVIGIPSPDEQRKIGTLFERLDSLIDLQRRELEKLRQFKQAMLSKMFPGPVATVPEVRFPGFTESWAEKSLGELGVPFSGLTGRSKADFGHGNAEYITYRNVFSNPIASSEGTEKVQVDTTQNEIRYGDVLFTTSSEVPEEVGMSSVWASKRRNVYLNSFCFGWRPKQPMDLQFVARLLRSPSVREKLVYLAQGISRYNISKNKAMDIRVRYPAAAEQHQIGQFFFRLDELITLQERKSEKLSQLKRALLDRMFV